MIYNFDKLIGSLLPILVNTVMLLRSLFVLTLTLCTQDLGLGMILSLILGSFKPLRNL